MGQLERQNFRPSVVLALVFVASISGTAAEPGAEVRRSACSSDQAAPQTVALCARTACAALNAIDSIPAGTIIENLRRNRSPTAHQAVKGIGPDGMREALRAHEQAVRENDLATRVGSAFDLGRFFYRSGAAVDAFRCFDAVLGVTRFLSGHADSPRDWRAMTAEAALQAGSIAVLMAVSGKLVPTIDARRTALDEAFGGLDTCRVPSLPNARAAARLLHSAEQDGGRLGRADIVATARLRLAQFAVACGHKPPEPRVIVKAIEAAESLPLTGRASHRTVLETAALVLDYFEGFAPADPNGSLRAARGLIDRVKRSAPERGHQDLAFEAELLLARWSMMSGNTRHGADRLNRLIGALETVRTGTGRRLSYDRLLVRSLAELGRLHYLQSLRDTPDRIWDRRLAVTAYQSAYAVLETIRTQIPVFDPETGEFILRDLIDPVYLSLLALKQSAENTGIDNTVSIIEALRVSEMEDYYQDRCIAAGTGGKEPVQKIAALTARGGSETRVGVLYVTFIDRRFQVQFFYSGQDGPGHTSHTTRSLTGLETARLRDLDSRLEDEKIGSRPEDFGSTGSLRLLFDVVLGPIEARLGPLEGILDVLVFVPDRTLRSIPIAAWHDGTDYLVAREVAVVTIPAVGPVDLRQAAGERPRRGAMSVLMAGASTGFSSSGLNTLPYAVHSLYTVQSDHKDRHRIAVLSGARFTRDNLRSAVRRSRPAILHIASHTHIGDHPEETRIATPDGSLTMTDLRALSQMAHRMSRPLDLLSLSACDTARGGPRASLGLSSMGVRAGARSVLGSLWKVSDRSAAILMRQYYRELAKFYEAGGERRGLTKAHALRHAQNILRKTCLGDKRRGAVCAHAPYHWAPFILAGDWL